MTKKTRKKSSRPAKSLFDVPSAQASTSEKADYLEVLALRETDHDVSQQDLIEIAGRADEEDPDKDVPGVESDLALENQAAETLDEHKQRLRDLGLAGKL